VVKVFNTSVDNAVEKQDRIFVSDSARNGSAVCTGVGAGTFVLQPSVDVIRDMIRNMIGNMPRRSEFFFPSYS
jgi:hypothetical protein